VNEAMRDWVTNVRHTHYILGTAYGAHPYPMMVRDFHRVIGLEARRQILEREERLPICSLPASAVEAMLSDSLTLSSMMLACA